MYAVCCKANNSAMVTPIQICYKACPLRNLYKYSYLHPSRRQNHLKATIVATVYIYTSIYGNVKTRGLNPPQETRRRNPCTFCIYTTPVITYICNILERKQSIRKNEYVRYHTVSVLDLRCHSRTVNAPTITTKTEG